MFIGLSFILWYWIFKQRIIRFWIWLLLFVGISGFPFTLWGTIRFRIIAWTKCLLLLWTHSILSQIIWVELIIRLVKRRLFGLFIWMWVLSVGIRRRLTIWIRKITWITCVASSSVFVNFVKCIWRLVGWTWIFTLIAIGFRLTIRSRLTFHWRFKL
jgi:hypothetical protein